jgi:hypothetical protein
VALLAAGAAAESPCDPALEQSATDSLRYTLRGDRCEGRYIQEVGSATLFPVSLTRGVVNYDLAFGEELRVEWPSLPRHKVHLRAYSLRRPPYYRMDTIRPPHHTVYHWPTDILAAFGIVRRDLGVIGWMTRAVGGTEREVLLPLRISQAGRPAPARTCTMILWPGRELSEVYLSLAPVRADGSRGAFIKKGQALEYGYYPAEQGIEFEISGMTAPGIYYLRIGADLASGGVLTSEHWVYHAR